jgi:hypothetical protein
MRELFFTNLSKLALCAHKLGIEGIQELVQKTNDLETLEEGHKFITTDLFSQPLRMANGVIC